MTPTEFRERFMPPHTTVQGPRPYFVAFDAYGSRCFVEVRVERAGFRFVLYTVEVCCTRPGAFVRHREEYRADNRTHTDMDAALDVAARLLMGDPVIAAGIQEEELMASAGPGRPGGRGGL